MSDIEDMENMMAAAGGPPAVGVEPPASAVSVTPVAAPPIAAPRLRMGGGASARDVALQGLSPALREQVIADAAEMGIRIEYDLSWLLVGAQVRSWAAAQASGEAAREVAAGVGKIQGQMFAGAVKAGDSVRKDMVEVIQKGGDALLEGIKVAAQAGSDKVAEGSKDLISKLDAAVEAKKAEGVSAFARAAAEAAVSAANTASASVISESKIRLRWSAAWMAAIFLAYSGLGWAANSEYLSLSHQITPAPLVINPKTGKVNCGKITTANGREEVCEIR